jgi:DegV family protein with EDD domain
MLFFHAKYIKKEGCMVQIITDTTSCLPTDFAARYHIPVIPQIINFGNDSFYEGVDLDNDGFMTRLKNSSELPKTAAPPPELFSEVFERLIPLNEPILCIHPSAEVSGTVRSAFVAAQDYPQADIRIIDTRVLGSPLCTLVELAAQWAAESQDADTIFSRLQNLIGRARVYFLVPSLEFLQRGGRIGGAQALLGSVLQIKPILCLRDGRVDRYESERTYKRALARLKDIVLEQISHDGSGYLSVMHAGVTVEGQSLAADLGRLVNQAEVPVYNVPPAIVTHGGPGLLAASFFTD